GGLATAVSAIALPITILVAALGTLYLAWTNNWGGIQETTFGVLESIKGAFDAFLQFFETFWIWITTYTEHFMATFGPLIQSIVEMFKLTFQLGFEFVRTIVSGVFTAIVAT